MRVQGKRRKRRGEQKEIWTSPQKKIYWQEELE